MDGADVCRTSSRASRRPPDVISTAAILNPRWRRRKWRHPGPGARFSTPIVEGGGKWRPFRFRSPSWMTSFAGTGNEVIQDGDRKRKGRHFPPPSIIGVEKRALYYWYGMVWYGMVLYGVIWYDLIWCDMVWYYMIWWYDMMWYIKCCNHVNKFKIIEYIVRNSWNDLPA